MSFWVPRASKMDAMSDLADITKTFGKNMVFDGLGGLEAEFGSLEELLAGLLAGWMETGWLADGLVAAGWLAGRPQGPGSSAHGQVMVKVYVGLG